GLNFIGPDFLVILAQMTILLQPLQLIHAVPADITDRHTRLFCIAARNAGKFLPALLIEVRDWNADQCTINRRIKTKPRFDDRFLNRRDITLVPDLNADHARLGHAYGADLGQWHLAAIGINDD